MKRRPFKRTTVLVLFAGAALLAACDSGSDWSGAKGGHASPPAPGDYWTIQAGVAGRSSDTAGIIVDAAGNVIVTGTTNGGLGGNTVAGTYDYFVTKYAVSRDRMYTKQSGTAGRETGSTGIAVDADGSVYVTGYTYGALEGNTLTGTRDYFVAKYTATGGPVYTIQAGAPPEFANVTSYTSSNGIAVDAAGNVYVAGEVGGGLDGNTATGASDYFVTKYTPTGNRIYTRQSGTAGASTRGTGVAVDTDGNVYVTGTTSGGLAGNNLTGTWDCFVTKYTATGTWVYTKQRGFAGKATQCYGVAVDPAGNVFVTGSTNGGLDGNTLAGTSDYFITKYTSAGGWIYTVQGGAAGSSTDSAAIAVDADGSVYVTGHTDGVLDGNTLTGVSDYFLVKYTSAGTRVFTRQSGAIAARTAGRGVAVDPAGTIYVTGRTDGGLDGNTLAGFRDYFIAKYDPFGNRQ